MWQLKQLERLHEIEPDAVDTAIGVLLEKEPVLREKVIIGAYIDGDINFGKTAELLNIHPVKLREIFLARGIPVKIGVESKEEMLAEGFSAKGIRKDLK
ncbi:MAG: hypothetical protein FJ241_10940 [Nitrospira sp.]|nr:hypothetical protein [Nitrospira sp.]